MPKAALMVQYHSALPDATPEAFCPWTTDAGRKSYQLVADAVADVADGSVVLDLGCGGGLLWELLGAGPAARMGVDLTRDQIEAASVDVVVSHMALMLMRPLDVVIDEIRWTLWLAWRPDGLGAQLAAGFSGASVADHVVRWRATSTQHAAHVAGMYNVCQMPDDAPESLIARVERRFA